ncbi:MAG: class I SAM-dependent methyltransferase, partial [Cyanobacteriota bacterium]
MNFIMQDNVYGHAKKIQWLKTYLTKQQKILEFGCGTGFMITLPLLKLGYDIYGIDLDAKSIAHGKCLFLKERKDPNRLMLTDLNDCQDSFDVIIVSEVLEHLSNNELKYYIDLIKSKLTPQGFLLVTVPNGFGWFELESFVWFKLGVGKIVEVAKCDRVIRKIKNIFIKIDYTFHDQPSTLSSSPHLQKFTYYSI